MLALMLGTALGFSVPKNIFGPDDRIDLPSSKYPYSAIGYLDSGCTGTLVGRRLILTAAHCLYDPETNSLLKDLKYFHPNMINGKSARPTKITRYWIGNKRPEQDRWGDWAFALLAEPVGDNYKWIPLESVNFSGRLPYKVDLAGYSVDRGKGQTLSGQSNCFIRKLGDGQRFLHDCDATSGISGAPMFHWVNGKPFIVAISVSEYRNGASDSVHVNYFEDKYANVALAVSSFYKTWQSLQPLAK